MAFLTGMNKTMKLTYEMDVPFNGYRDVREDGEPQHCHRRIPIEGEQHVRKSRVLGGAKNDHGSGHNIRQHLPPVQADLKAIRCSLEKVMRV